jgi:hypothetical protein
MATGAVSSGDQETSDLTCLYAHVTLRVPQPPAWKARPIPKLPGVQASRHSAVVLSGRGHPAGRALRGVLYGRGNPAGGAHAARVARGQCSSCEACSPRESWSPCGQCARCRASPAGGVLTLRAVNTLLAVLSLHAWPAGVLTLGVRSQCGPCSRWGALPTGGANPAERGHPMGRGLRTEAIRRAFLVRGRWWPWPAPSRRFRAAAAPRRGGPPRAPPPR